MTAEQAHQIDRNDPEERGLWAAAIAKEMKAVNIAFEFRLGAQPLSDTRSSNVTSFLTSSRIGLGRPGSLLVAT
jgi:hypothetical protein